MSGAVHDSTGTTPRAPEPVLEWETRTPRQSRFSRFLPGGGGGSQQPYQNHDPEQTSGDAMAAQKELGQQQQAEERQHFQSHGQKSHWLDRILPPHKTFLGMRRRTFLIALAAAAVALLILIIGLAAGISSSRAGKGKAVPLPDTGTDGKTYSGDLTFYKPGLGACGEVHGEDDMVVAIAWELYDEAGKSDGSSNPNDNPLCGRKIRISADGGRDSIEVTVVDRCEGCKPTDLDLSPGAFDKIANADDGRVDCEWQWA